LGSCTLIASDKTGTLTANTLTVRSLQLPDEDELQISGDGYEIEGEITLDDDDDSPNDSQKDQARAMAVAGTPLLEQFMRDGKRVRPPNPPNRSRDRAAEQLASLPDAIRAVDHAAQDYPMELSESLREHRDRVQAPGRAHRRRRQIARP